MPKKVAVFVPAFDLRRWRFPRTVGTNTEVANKAIAPTGRFDALGATGGMSILF